MNRRRQPGFSLFWSIALSFIVGYTLTTIPTPQAIFYFWPDWIALIVVYWALMAPDRIGPWVGFVFGTLLEVLFVRDFGVLGSSLDVFGARGGPGRRCCRNDPLHWSSFGSILGSLLE